MNTKALQDVKIQWKDANVNTYDHLVCSQGGHPLQSGTWGDAREEVDAIRQLKLEAYLNGEVLATARIEVRKLPLVGPVAWIPRGPVFTCGFPTDQLLHSLASELKQRGFVAYAYNPWTKIKKESTTKQTIQIDLRLSKDQLLKNMDSKSRYGIRKAKKDGIEVCVSDSKEALKVFFELCIKVSKHKSFILPGSENLMMKLLSSTSEDIEPQFFRARLQEQVVGGAVLIRSGKNTHYLWGAVDRNFSKYNIGQAIQWAMIQWSKDKQCTLYDMEGIDPKRDPGTYNFKRKMGGQIIHLPPVKVVGLSLVGCFIVPILRLKLR